jgi:hypothetical protein
MRAIRKAVGFAHGLRGFGGTVEVCSGEGPSGWYLPSIHREGPATVLAAVDDGDSNGRGDPAEVTQPGADRGRLRAHVTLGPLEGRPRGDAGPVDHNGTPPRPTPVSMETRPALDGHSAGRSTTLPDAKMAVKPLSEESFGRSRNAPRGLTTAARGAAETWRCCRRRRWPRARGRRSPAARRPTTSARSSSTTRGPAVPGHDPPVDRDRGARRPSLPAPASNRPAPARARTPRPGAHGAPDWEGSRTGRRRPPVVHTPAGRDPGEPRRQ